MWQCESGEVIKYCQRIDLYTQQSAQKVILKEGKKKKVSFAREVREAVRIKDEIKAKKTAKINTKLFSSLNLLSFHFIPLSAAVTHIVNERNTRENYDFFSLKFNSHFYSYLPAIISYLFTTLYKS